MHRVGVTPSTRDHDRPELWRRSQTGDVRAREELIRAHFRLVRSVARRLSRELPSHIDEADLISSGLVGLIAAIDRFDPAREAKFEAFALPRIKGAMLDELRSLDWAPRSLRRGARAIAAARDALERRLGRVPSEMETARSLGMSVEEVRGTLAGASSASVISLEAGTAVEGRSTPQVRLLDRVLDPTGHDPAAELAETTAADELADAIARLPERERVVIGLFYYEDVPLVEIAEILGVSDSRVSQLHGKAVARLRRGVAV